MNTTARTAATTVTSFVTRTSLKAFLFGLTSTLVVAAGMAHAHEQRELRASIVTLDPVVITKTRVSPSDIETLPTVIITGRRAAQRDDTHLAAAAGNGAAQTF